MADMFVVGEDGTIRGASGELLYAQDPDGTLRDASGKVIVFSVERFIDDICIGNHCFICGVSPNDAPFNDEHIVPRWVLEFTGQFNGALGLPNQTSFKGYGAYKLPCCVACNTGLSVEFESVFAPLFKAGYPAMRRHLVEHGATGMFRWMALMYLKTHLRDARLRISKDRRAGGDHVIGDLYDWAALHHVHCIARSHHSGINFDPRKIGTMLILPALTRDGVQEFDYADVYLGRTIMIRIGEIACFAVLNDAFIVGNYFPRVQRVLEKDAPLLTPLQLRELYVELVWRNICLKSRPSFATMPLPTPHFEVRCPEEIIFAHPTPEELNGEQASYGKLLRGVLADYIDAIQPLEKRSEIESLAMQGRLTFFEHDVPRWPAQR